VEQLKRFDDTFRIRTDGAVEFVPALSTPELRTAAVAGETPAADGSHDTQRRDGHRGWQVQPKRQTAECHARHRKSNSRAKPHAKTHN
jgi:hypothetical protein